MPETVTTPPKPDSKRMLDKSVFTEVEKWLEVIRDLNREQKKG